MNEISKLCLECHNIRGELRIEARAENWPALRGALDRAGYAVVLCCNGFTPGTINVRAV